MKNSRSTTVSLQEAEAQLVSVALVAYANAAYPPGGSECSQASNQTLKDIASRINQSHVTAVEIKKRQMPMIKAAIRWFYDPQSKSVEMQGIDPETLIERLFS